MPSGSPSTGISPRAVLVAFTALMAIVLAFSVSPAADVLLPEVIASQLTRNTEALAFVLLAALDLGFHTRPPILIWRLLWWAFLLVTYAITAFGPGDVVPPQTATLAEAFLGAFILSIYLILSRDDEGVVTISKWIFPVTVAILAVVAELPVEGREDSGAAGWIIENAEAWAFAILGALLLDSIQPYPWERKPAAAFGLQLAWLIGLVAVPVLVASLNTHGVDSSAAVGPVESLMVWIQRSTEAFIAALILWLYALVQRRVATPN